MEFHFNLRGIFQVRLTGSGLNLARYILILLRVGGNDGLAWRLNEEGEVLEVLDVGARIIRPITEVEERDGRLWIGSLDKPFVGVYKP